MRQSTNNLNVESFVAMEKSNSAEIALKGPYLVSTILVDPRGYVLDMDTNGGIER